MRNRLVVIAGVLLASLPALGVQQFMDLGPGTHAPSISKDGTLIGGAENGNGFIAVYGVKTYTPGAIPVDVEYLNGLPTAVGTTSSAAIWQAGSWQTLPLAGGSETWTATGIGVAPDNRFWASGYAGPEGSRTPIRFDSATNRSVNIGVPSPGSDGRLTSVSDTGAVGGTADYGGSPRHAFYGLPVSWLESDAGVGSSVESEVFDISSDGVTKVGWGYASSGAWQAHYWTAGTLHLIPLYNGVDWAEGHAVDGDGDVFGGWSYTDTNYNVQIGWIWQPGWAAPKSVEQYLTELGVDTTGWFFTNVTGISYDGLSFVGTGTFNGTPHTWAFSVVPEPGALALLALGCGLVIRRR